MPCTRCLREGNLEDERHRLVETALWTIPTYRPPYDYHRSTKFSEKVYVPVADFPGVNFTGQILGPRGSSLKEMNDQSGTTIAIRGRGSVKEGKGRSKSRATDNLQEPLHCLITADSPQKVNKAMQLVNGVIETATSTSEHENGRKQEQIRHLAMMNGTFRDDECQQGRNWGSRLIGDDHVTSSATRPATKARVDEASQDALDREYQQLMTEINGDDSVGATNPSLEL